MRLSNEQFYIKQDEISLIKKMFHHKELLKKDKKNHNKYFEYVLNRISSTLFRGIYLSWDEIIFVINVARKVNSVKKFNLYLEYYLICRNQEKIQRAISSDISNKNLKVVIELERIEQVGFTVNNDGEFITVKVLKYQKDIITLMEKDFNYKSVIVYNYYLSFFSQFKLKQLTTKKSMKNKIKKINELESYSTKTSNRLLQEMMDNVVTLDTEFLKNVFMPQSKKYTTALIEIAYVSAAIDLLNYESMTTIKSDYSKIVDYKGNIVRKTYVPSNYNEIFKEGAIKNSKKEIANDLLNNISNNDIVFIWGSEDIKVLINEFRKKNLLKNKVIKFVNLQPLFSFAMFDKGFERRYNYGLKDSVDLIEKISNKTFMEKPSYHNALTDSYATLFVLEYLIYSYPYETFLYISLMTDIVGF